MPNHTAQKLYIIGSHEDIRAIRDLVGVEFDHEKILPMPEELQGTCSPVDIVSQEEYDRLVECNKDSPKFDVFGMPTVRGITQEMSNQLKQRFGADNWYDWAMENWGTKWGIYSANWVDIDAVEFQSAWTPADKVIVALSKLFPDVKFRLKAADECGLYVCEYFIKNGVSTQYDYEWNSGAGYDIRQDVGHFSSENPWGEEAEQI